MIGSYIGGAACGLPVVVDGVIACAAALCAVRLCPAARDYLIISHQSAEPAGRSCCMRWMPGRYLSRHASG